MYLVRVWVMVRYRVRVWVSPIPNFGVVGFNEVWGTLNKTFHTCLPLAIIHSRFMYCARGIENCFNMPIIIFIVLFGLLLVIRMYIMSVCTWCNMCTYKMFYYYIRYPSRMEYDNISALMTENSFLHDFDGSGVSSFLSTSIFRFKIDSQHSAFLTVMYN